ncbi:MAG: hypothetical protein K9I26_05750 [Flavobacterium sp.]|nr:hypothetical protein [Flavobacterium sp.]
MIYFLENLKSKNETLFYFGILCLIGAVICLILSKTNPNPILGISGWIKPFKFFISTTVMAWTMGYYMQFLDNQSQVSIYNWSLIILLSIEIILILFQASRGTVSHFNQENALGKIIFSTMAFVITAFMLHTAFIASFFFTQKQFNASEILVLAIQLSLIITILFAFEGFIMGAMLKHTVGSTDGSEGLPVVNWSKKYGDLRIAHFFGMHSLQLIPLLAFYFTKTKREVFILASIYFVFVSYTLFQALQGKPLLKL